MTDSNNRKFLISLLLNAAFIAALIVIWWNSHLETLRGTFVYINPLIESRYNFTHLVIDNVNTRGTYSKYQSLGSIVEHGFVTFIEDNIYLLQSEHGDVERRVIRRDNDVLYLVNDDGSVLIFHKIDVHIMRFGFPSPFHFWDVDEFFSTLTIFLFLTLSQVQGKFKYFKSLPDTGSSPT